MTWAELEGHIRAMSAEASLYDLRRADGTHIRKATQVRFSDGDLVRFVERIPKAQAIHEARQYRLSAAREGKEPR